MVISLDAALGTTAKAPQTQPSASASSSSAANAAPVEERCSAATQEEEEDFFNSDATAAAPPLYAVPTHGTWVRDNLRGVGIADAIRIGKALHMAKFDVNDVVRVDLHTIQHRSDDSSCMYYRIKLQNWQRAELNDPDPDAWPFSGFHATDVRGAIKIIGETRIRAINFPGVYCMLVQNPKHMNDTMQAASVVFNGKKDWARCIFEL